MENYDTIKLRQALCVLHYVSSLELRRRIRIEPRHLPTQLWRIDEESFKEMKRVLIHAKRMPELNGINGESRIKGIVGRAWISFYFEQDNYAALHPKHIQELTFMKHPGELSELVDSFSGQGLLEFTSIKKYGSSIADSRSLTFHDRVRLQGNRGTNPITKQEIPF